MRAKISIVAKADSRIRSFAKSFANENSLIKSEFEQYGLAPSRNMLLNPGASIPKNPAAWTNPAITNWANWDNALKSVSFPGLSYRDCRFNLSYFWFARRGDRSVPILSQSWTLVSRWSFCDSASNRYNFGSRSGCLVVMFPAIDGISYWIGKRRRKIIESLDLDFDEKMERLSYYSNSYVKELSFCAADGAFLLDRTSSRLGNDFTLYKSALFPGRIYSENSELLDSPANYAFIERLQFSAYEYGKAQQRMRVYGKTERVVDSKVVEKLRYSPALARELANVWFDILNSFELEMPFPDETFY